MIHPVPFKTGMIVPDLARAQRELSEQLGLAWTPVQVAALELETAAGRERVDLPFVFSTGEPPYLELLQGQPSGYYRVADQGTLHHVGLWVDDLVADSQALAARGMPREAAGVEDGRTPALFCFHRSPHGLRIELVGSANRENFEAWLAGGELAL